MKLKKIKDSLEGFFYKVRLNIAWQSSLSSSEVGEFNNLMRSAIERQILHFAKVEQINRIFGVAKAVLTLTAFDVLDSVQELWIPILDIIEAEELQVYHLWASNQGGQIAVDKIGADGTFELTDEVRIITIKEKYKTLVYQIEKTSQDWVARTVEQGLREGMSHVEIAEMLRDSARKVARRRAELISENEATTLMGEMEMEVYRESGIKYTTWITARDELTCPLCMANEEAGQVQVGHAFPSGATAPPQHSHCRCFVRPFITSGEEIWYGG